MSETPLRQTEPLINRVDIGESVRAERSKSDETLREERAATDASLREERSVTDELIDDQHNEDRVVEAVRERRIEAAKILRDVRADSDGQLEKHADALPAIAETLEDVAEGLAKASATLADVATALQDSGDDLAANVAQIAEALNDTPQPVKPPVEPPASPPEPPAGLTEQLADIADGIAKITSTLSDERRDADQSLRQEREITDRLILQELTEVESNLGEELREERQALRQERQATDEDLANERRSTDDAVEHVQSLLVEEQRDHAHTARGVSTRNEFLGIVSHDLRGPLMTISAVAALMERHAAGDETGQRIRAWADRVHRSVNVMERLISDLLDFNCFEDGQLQVAAERLDIRPLIHSTMDAFQGVAQAKGLSLEADVPAEALVTKHDPNRMLQVLSNLVQNAIKFTADGGAIRIRVARAGTFCQISVSDTGVGIPRSELSEIFERFRQLNPTDRTGLGLGLYISRWIVEAHGGRIWAESQVGAGSTFHVTLPEDRRTA